MRFFVCLAVCLAGLVSARAGYVPARPADEFVQSCGVCTHLTYTDKAYYQQWPVVRQKLLALGVRFIRDGGASQDMVNKMRDLANHGMRTMWVLDPGAGVVPTNRFWSPSSVPRQYLVNFLKNTGPQVFDSVEVMNEIDLFYNRGWISDYSQAGYFYLAGNTNPTNHLNSDPASPLWWGKYIVDMTQSTWRAMRADPATAHIPIVGPSFGGFHDKPPTGVNSLKDWVDWGCFHPYPFGGNPFSDRAGYATVDWYIGHGQQPSCNIDEWPFAFNSFQPAYGTKRMAATETGWFTGNANNSVSEAAQAKYVPRLYLEYFRSGIARCAHYEFLDEGTNPSDNEQNRGLLRHDLSAKPAYTALQNLLTLLSDRGSAFEPEGLDYTVTRGMPAGYTRGHYLRHLLFQKGDGSYWMVLWHEIASSSYYTSAGQPITGTARDIPHPDVTVTLNFNTPIAQAELFRSNLSTNVVSTHEAIKSLNFKVNDTPVLVKLRVGRPEIRAAASAPGQVRLVVTGVPGYRHVVERSADLQTWVGVATNTLSTAEWVYEAPANGGQAVYRAVAR